MPKQIDDVLIVGGGPTGLLLACLLAGKVRLRIIERRPSSNRDSRAIALNSIVLHLLDNEGLLEPITRRASRLDFATVWWNNRRQTSIKLFLLNSPYNYFLFQPQPFTEEGLEAVLRDRGISVERNTEALEVSQSEEHAEVRLRRADGSVERARARYVIGCDGPQSRVRQDAGISFLGHSYDMHFVIGDVRLDWPPLGKGAHYLVYEDTFLVVVPMGPPGCARVLVKRNGPYDREKKRALSEINEVLERIGPPNMRATEAFWLSGAPFFMRLADRARRGRLLLVGDALHLFSPIGVMGMNTGLQDAFNLAWKLVLACQNEAVADRLLTSYEEERLPAAQATAAQTDRSTQLISRLEKRPSETDAFLPTMKNRRIWRNFFPEQYSGMRVTYGQSRALASPLVSGVGCLNPLAPQIARWLASRPSERANVNPLQLLAFLRDGEHHAHWRSILEETKAFGAHVLGIEVHEAGSDARSADAALRLPEELAAPLRKGLSAQAGEVFVVRPDTYVGLRLPLSSCSEVSSYLRALLAPAPSQNGAP